MLEKINGVNQLLMTFLTTRTERTENKVPFSSTELHKKHCISIQKTQVIFEYQTERRHIFL